MSHRLRVSTRCNWKMTKGCGYVSSFQKLNFVKELAASLVLTSSSVRSSGRSIQDLSTVYIFDMCMLHKDCFDGMDEFWMQIQGLQRIQLIVIDEHSFKTSLHNDNKRYAPYLLPLISLNGYNSTPIVIQIAADGLDAEFYHELVERYEAFN
jgi:hypothetical protein